MSFGVVPRVGYNWAGPPLPTDGNLPESRMKLWFEFPETTRFARFNFDILYTPIFFANSREGITGHLCLEVNESQAHETITDHTAEISLAGSASLGLLNIGGRPLSMLDSRYAFSSIGFRPIVTVDLYDEHDTFNLDAGSYTNNGVIGRRIPFSFQPPVGTLNELREFTPSMKLISSDTYSTLDVLKEISPTMLLSVKYLLRAHLVRNRVTTFKTEQEIRIFVSMNQDQVPAMLPDVTPDVLEHRRSSVVSLKARARPLMPGRRKSVHDGETHVIVEAEDPAPFEFQVGSDDGAATKIPLTLTYSGTELGEAPGSVDGSVQWMLKSLSSVAVQPTNRDQEDPPSEDAFHLKTKHLPMHKRKLRWTKWERVSPGEGLNNAWRSVQDVWVTQAITSSFTPTFRTSFISHSYNIELSVSVSGKGLRNKGYKVDLNVPVKVRYDIGLAPSYSIDRDLPHYSVDEDSHVEQAGPPPEFPWEANVTRTETETSDLYGDGGDMERAETVAEESTSLVGSPSNIIGDDTIILSEPPARMSYDRPPDEEHPDDLAALLRPIHIDLAHDRNGTPGSSQ